VGGGGSPAEAADRLEAAVSTRVLVTGGAGVYAMAGLANDWQEKDRHALT
jgi:hypothetical protein